MAKKQESEHNVEFAKGGNTPMFGLQQAEPKTPGNTRPDAKPGPGAKFAEGGSNKMFGFSPSVPARSGITGPR